MKDKRITLKLKISNLRKEQAVALVNMLQEMEYFGSVGLNSYVGFFAAGDENFHPKVSHNLLISNEKIKNFSKISKIYEKDHCTSNIKEKRFPWTDHITLFDFGGLVSQFKDK